MMGNRKDHIRVRKQRQRKTKSDNMVYRWKITEWMICTYFQKNVTQSETTVLLGHTPTTNILHSQCATIDPAHQRKAQPTFLRLGELHLEDTALHKREEQEHLVKLNSKALLTLDLKAKVDLCAIIRTDCSHCHFSSDEIRSSSSDQMGQYLS